MAVAAAASEPTARRLHERVALDWADDANRAQIAHIQRARVLAAMCDAAAARGARNTSVAHVVELAGVSRRTFYELFASCEDCFLAAFEDALAGVSQRVTVAYRSAGNWHERIRAGLVALLSFLEEKPTLARVLIVESLAAGSKVIQRRDQLALVLAAAVDEGRLASSSDAVLPALTAEGLVGCASSLIHSRVANPERESLTGLTNQLMSMIVLPYLGPAAARRELDRPLPARMVEGGEAPVMFKPFKEAGMRLTYRTVRVLLEIADHPRTSNRSIGERAGISDQGQTSKLLGRLQRAGLISNAGVGPGQGAPNEWSLTVAGGHLVESIRAHTQIDDEG
jgi:AcrR family transcriptional regulator/DNA-binding MarR family transcriptional regulator